MVGFASLFLATVQGEGSDGTSLMQAVYVKEIHRSDKKSVSTLLETAGNMLRTGATPDVVNFTSATLNEITGIVVPAIADASEVDQGLLNSMHAQFEAALAALELGNRRIHQMNEEREALSTQHKLCRLEEEDKCRNKVTCDYHLYDLWKTFVDEESEMRFIEGNINEHFCVQDEHGYYIANGTVAIFRATSIPYMTSFISQKVRVDMAEDHYDNFNPYCQSNYTALDEKTADCDALQFALESSACTHAEAVRTVQTEFSIAWNDALFAYNLTVAEVKLQEIDRIAEYRTLTVVQCLLDRVHQRNGRPCDESTDEAAMEITICEEVRRTTDITWLELIYHIVEPHPQYCADRHAVIGRCYPEMPHFPCQPQYINEEYGSLPEVPMPEFSETNSHCNIRPDCQTCTELQPEPETDFCTSMSALQRYELCADTTVTAAPVTTAGPVTTVSPVTAAPEPECGPLPQLTNAVWAPSSTGLLQYYCEDGFSFDSLSFVHESRDIECLASGYYTEVRACRSIDDCVGHSCGAFGTCVDLHMDYTCECADGYDLHVEHGEKVCGNVDDCDGVQCGEGGVCVDLIQEHDCLCHEGWEQTVVDGVKTCERVECGDVPHVANLVATVDDPATSSGIFPWTRGKAVFEETVEYTCSHGYSTDGLLNGPRTFSVSCQANRNFTEVMECLPISCGAPESIGSSTPSSDSLVLFGQTVDYHCPPGMVPNTFTRSCLGNGQFSPAIACEPRLCNDVPEFTLASLTSTKTMFFFGERAEFSCPEGFTTDPTNPLARDFAVECLTDGWETGIEGCHPISCEVHPDETHAADTAFSIEYNGINILLCADGHTVDGTAQGPTEFTAICTPNGLAEVQSCRPVTCSAANLQFASHAQVTDHSDYTLGTRATYTCDEGHAVALTSASTFEVECLRSGFFSAMSTCRNIDDCVGHSCGSKGRCVDEIGDYSCDCEDGFEETVSDAGEKICGNINDCGPGACGSNGACHQSMCECHHGYDVQGTGTDEICVPKLCPIPELTGASTTESELHFPDTLFVECTEGYSLGDRTDFQIECNADGVLVSSDSAELPECRPIVCGQPPAVFAVEVEVRDFVFGEIAVSVCERGNVQIEHLCQADGQFRVTSEFSTCQNSCGFPSLPTHAFRLDGVGAVVHPASASYLCYPGFTPLESGMPGQLFSQACGADGVFEPLSLAVNGCVPVVCERPTAPPNWEWVQNWWVSDAALTTQTSAFLRCADGFQSNGLCGWASQVEITCDSNAAHSALPAACEETSFTLSGRIRSALPPRGIISGATLSIAGETHVSNDRGEFSISLPAGTHDYTLSADGYISITEGSVRITGSSEEYDLNMSPLMDEDSWRIVLTWDENPRDLDSHLVFHGESTNEWYGCPEMYYRRPRATCGGVEANLNVDDTDSWGPETTSLSHVNSCGWGRTCKWVYKVKNYSADYNADDGWDQSNAVVTLYNKDQLVSVFRVGSADGYVTSNGRGYTDTAFWSVFSIDADGSVEQCTNENCD